MKETNNAAFSLEHYKVSNFTFTDPGDNTDSVNIKFSPSGKFFSKEGKFILTFGVTATYGEMGNELLTASMDALFKFNGSITFEEIPVYFYRNSIAIVFPYLRAFVSTLTSVANSKPIILPVMNLTSLEEPLKNNTKQEN